MWEFRHKNQYLNYVSDLLQDEAVHSMRRLPRRVTGISRYHHCLLVSYAAWGLCLWLGLDARAAARGGLLLELAPPADGSAPAGSSPLPAARARFSLTKKEENILASHRFPLPPVPLYRSPEAAVVSLMGKLCTAAELLGLVPLLTRRRRERPLWLDAEWVPLPLGGAG